MSPEEIFKYYFWSPGTPFVIVQLACAMWAWKVRTRSPAPAYAVLFAVAFGILAQSLYLLSRFFPTFELNQAFFSKLNLVGSILRSLAFFLLVRAALQRAANDRFASTPGSRPPETWSYFDQR